MIKSKSGFPISALYTAGAWKWAKLPYSDLLTPKVAGKIFIGVNLYLFFYRLINPAEKSLRHSLIHRHVLINNLLVNSKIPQIIEIASGLSPRGVERSKDLKYSYYEVDLPAVIAAKQKILEHTNRGRNILLRSNFVLQSGNILNLDYNNLFPNKKTFLITEGLMMYFNRSKQMQIWNSIAQFLSHVGGEYTFDYVPADYTPPKSYLGKLIGKLLNRNGHKTNKMFAYDERTRNEILTDLKTAGFKHVQSHHTGESATTFSLPFPKIHETGYPISAVRYEDLVQDPDGILALLFSYLDLPSSAIEKAKGVITEDTQKGSAIARDNSKKQFCLSEKDRMKIRKFLKTFPIINSTDYRLPSTIYSSNMK